MCLRAFVVIWLLCLVFILVFKNVRVSFWLCLFVFDFLVKKMSGLFWLCYVCLFLLVVCVVFVLCLFVLFLLGMHLLYVRVFSGLPFWDVFCSWCLVVLDRVLFVALF